MKRNLDRSRHAAASILRLFGGDFGNKAILVAINILLIRRMQPTQFAAFATMFALVQFSYQATCGVIERLYIAEHQCVRGKERTILNVLMLFSSTLIGGYFAITSDWVSAAFTITCSYAFGSFQLSRIRLQKQERYGAFVSLDGIRIVLSLIILIPVLMTPDLLDNFQALGVIAVFAIGALFAEQIARSFMAVPRHPEASDYLIVLSLLIERTPLLIYSLIGGLLPFLTIFLANVFGNANTVAEYGVALRYQSILSMLAVATNVYMLPRMSNAGSASDSIREARRFIRYTPQMTAVVCIYIGMVWILMPILNGHDYDNARPVFVLLSFCAASSLMATPFTNLLVRQQMHRALFFSMAIGLLVTILFSTLLVPALNYLAFATGSLIGYFLINGIIIAQGYRIMRKASEARGDNL